MPLDLKLFYLLNNLAGHRAVFDGIVVFFASYSQYVLGALFFWFLYKNSVSKSEKFRIFWTVLLSGVVARLGFTSLIRLFYHRPRPYMLHHVNQLITAQNGGSFPSGHAAFFFAISGALYAYDKRWGAGFFAASLLMGLSRVIAGIHYPLDILGGILVGIWTAYAVIWVSEYLDKKRADTA